MCERAPFKYFKTNLEVIRLTVMMYVRLPLSLRNVEGLLHKRWIDVRRESVRLWWSRFGPVFAFEIKRKKVDRVRALSRPIASRIVGDRRLVAA